MIAEESLQLIKQTVKQHVQWLFEDLEGLSAFHSETLVEEALEDICPDILGAYKSWRERE